MKNQEKQIVVDGETYAPGDTLKVPQGGGEWSEGKIVNFFTKPFSPKAGGVVVRRGDGSHEQVESCFLGHCVKR